MTGPNVRAEIESRAGERMQDNPNNKETLISKAATMLHFFILMMPEKTHEQRQTVLTVSLAVFEDLSLEEATRFVSEKGRDL